MNTADSYLQGGYSNATGSTVTDEQLKQFRTECRSLAKTKTFANNEESLKFQRDCVRKKMKAVKSDASAPVATMPINKPVSSGGGVTEPSDKDINGEKEKPKDDILNIGDNKEKYFKYVLIGIGIIALFKILR